MTAPDLPPFVHPLPEPWAGHAEPLDLTAEDRAKLDTRLGEIAEARAQAVATAQRAVVWR